VYSDPSSRWRRPIGPSTCGLPGCHPDLLSCFDAAPFHVLCCTSARKDVTTGLAFYRGTDCGIYNAGPLDPARRRGLGSALTAVRLHDAPERGGETASLQSTAMAERMYAALGLRDLGRILEYVSAQPETCG
jgi:hypothetical protein